MNPPALRVGWNTPRWGFALSVPSFPASAYVLDRLERRIEMRHGLLFATTLSLSLPAISRADAGPVSLPASQFAIVERSSGPVNYYSKLTEGAEAFIRGEYRPPYKTAVLGVEVPPSMKRNARRLSWRWRALKLPAGGDECKNGRGDSAAVVYVTWKSGLKWYTIKYVWSSESPAGVTCDKKRNLFAVQDTVVLRSGGPTGLWRTEQIDPTAEFRRHFRDGDPEADVPELIGIGIMTDGDQTKSESAADYADFEIGS